MGVRDKEDCTNRTSYMGYIILFSHVGILLVAIFGSCCTCFGACLEMKCCIYFGYALSVIMILYRALVLSSG